MTPRTRLTSALIALALIIAGCVSNKPFNPAATQPVTVIDLATTQPSTYWNRPAVASVEAMNFQKLWDACAEAGRRYGFSLDRQDYREGLLASKALVSKQILEPWKKDTGTAHDVFENSLSTMRRTIHFEIENERDGLYRVTPKVLVERLTILEHRVTSAVEYRSIFAGPASLRSNTSVTADQPDEIIPVRYFTPIDRDTLLEKRLAKTIDALLKKSGQKAVLHIAPKNQHSPLPSRTAASATTKFHAVNPPSSPSCCTAYSPIGSLSCVAIELHVARKITKIPMTIELYVALVM